jgi:hypothetical protein
MKAAIAAATMAGAAIGMIFHPILAVRRGSGLGRKPSGSFTSSRQSARSFTFKTRLLRFQVFLSARACVKQKVRACLTGSEGIR